MQHRSVGNWQPCAATGFLYLQASEQRVDLGTDGTEAGKHSELGQDLVHRARNEDESLRRLAPVDSVGVALHRLGCSWSKVAPSG